MNEFLKKGFFLGLGIAAASKEKVEKYVRELVEKGKLTPKEAEEVIHSFIKKGEETEEKWNEKRKEKVRSALSDYDFVSTDQLHALEERIEQLEFRLRQLSAEKTNTEESSEDQE